MTSNRPYLIRAIYEWIVDNDATPYIVVDVSIAGVMVPQDHVNNGQIVLNVAHGIVKDLALGNRDIQFSARFQGKPEHIVVPILAVKAIYAKESGEGMGFSDEDGGDSQSGSSQGKAGAGSHLRVIK